MSRRTASVSALGGERLERGQQPPAHPEPADGRRDPQALDLRGRAVVEAQGAAPDRLGLQRRKEQDAGRRPQLLVAHLPAATGIEASGKAPLQLGRVLAHAVPRMGIGGID